MRHSAAWTYIDAITANASGVAQWSGVPAGTYNLQAYLSNTTHNVLELWEQLSVAVPASGTIAAPLPRRMPWAAAFRLFDGTRNVTYSTVPIGSTIRIEVVLTSLESITYPVRSAVWFTATPSVNPALRTTNPTVPIGGNQVLTQSFVTVVSTAGTYYRSLQVETDTGAGFIPTDAWSLDPVLTVVPVTGFIMTNSYVRLTVNDTTNWYGLTGSHHPPLPGVITGASARISASDIQTYPGAGNYASCDAMALVYRINAGTWTRIQLPFLQNVNDLGPGDKWALDAQPLSFGATDTFDFYFEGVSDCQPYQQGIPDGAHVYTNRERSSSNPYSLHLVADSDGPLAPVNVRMTQPSDTSGRSAYDQVTHQGSPTFEWSKPMDQGPSGTMDYYQWAVTGPSSDAVTGTRIREGFVNSTQAWMGIIPLSDGVYNFWVQARDNANNWGFWQGTQFRIDTISPNAPATLSNPNGQTAIDDLTPNVTWSASSDPGGGGIWVYVIEFARDGITHTLYSDDAVLDDIDYRDVLLTLGTWTWRARSIDVAGNPSAWTAAKQVDVTQPTLTIYWSDGLQQRIDGFGASCAFAAAANSTDFSEADADLFFSTNTPDGIGLSLLRTRISPDGTIAAAEEDLAHLAHARGARIWSTPWSPPGDWKTTGTTTNGGELIPAHYTNYAEQLAVYAASMEAKGIPLCAISVQNEPDFKTSYESCTWSPYAIHEFIPLLSDTLGTIGQSSVSILAAEQTSWDLRYTDVAMFDAASAGDIDILAAHGYGPDGALAPIAPYNSAGKALWLTEIADLRTNGVDFDPSIADGMTWARVIHQYLTVANVNAWHYWWMKPYIDDERPNQGLLSPSADRIRPKRLFALGQFSRFVRPGFRRMSVNPDGAELLWSAYRSTNNGAFAIVCINTNSASISKVIHCDSFQPTELVPWITNDGQSLFKLPPISVSDHMFFYTIPASSIVTFAGTTNSAAVSPIVTYSPDPPVCGQSCTITYHSTARNLALANPVLIHLGFNGWSPVITPDPAMAGSAGGTWTHTFLVDLGHHQVDCVFTDGSGTWDNNAGADWHKATFLPAPETPTELSATESYIDMVRVDWTPVAGATGYEIWRNSVNTVGTATRISPNEGVTAPPFDDATVLQGTTYYYWIRATNWGGTSAFSNVGAGRLIDPNLDSDNDQIPDWQETIAGTDPNSSMSFARLLSRPSPAATNWVVSWQAVSSRVYRLYFAPDVHNAYQPITPELTSTPPENVYTGAIPSSGDRGFWRLGIRQ